MNAPHLNHVRYEDHESADTSSAPSNAERDRIIIGVVVGGVAAIASTSPATRLMRSPSYIPTCTLMPHLMLHRVTSQD